MKPLAPFSGGLFRLASLTAGAVGVVALGFMFAEHQMRTRAGLVTTRESTLSYDGAAEPGTLSSGDRRFATAAAGLAEEAATLSELAAQRAVTEAVRTFAARMAARQHDVRDELAALAALRQVTLRGDGGVRATHRLAEKAPLAFDKDYLRDLVSLHEDEIALFENAARECDDAELREFARRTLPTLKANAALAQKLKPPSG